MLNVPPNTRVAIDGHKGLARDLNSMAIINTDKNVFAKHRAAKRLRMKEKEDLNKANLEIQNLRRDMEELKTQFKAIMVSKVEEKYKENTTVTAPNK